MEINIAPEITGVGSDEFPFWGPASCQVRTVGFGECKIAGKSRNRTPRKLTCPLKGNYFNRKCIFQPLTFMGHVSFPGSKCIFRLDAGSFHNVYDGLFHPYISRLDTSPK